MTLPDLARIVAEADAQELPNLIGQLAAAQAQAFARLAQPVVGNGTASEGDASIDAAEAARRLGISRCALYRLARSLPFTVRVGRRLTFSSAGLTKWRARRMGA